MTFASVMMYVCMYIIIHSLKLYVMSIIKFGYALACYPLVVVLLFVYHFDSILIGMYDISPYIPITFIWLLMGIIWAEIVSRWYISGQSFVKIVTGYETSKSLKAWWSGLYA